MLKATLTRLLEHGEIKPAYPEPLPLLTNAHGPGKYSVHYQRRNVHTNPATNPELYNADLLAKYAGAIAAQRL